MLRWLTAGESHGPALLATLEGLPAGVAVTTDDLADALARRRLGHGRGARMTFERDEVELLGGVRHGLTQGGPVAVRIGNTEWPKWQTGHERRPGAGRDAGGPGPQRPADPAATRPRRPRRDAEVRLRRRPPGARAGQRPRDRGPGRARRRRPGVPRTRPSAPGWCRHVVAIGARDGSGRRRGPSRTTSRRLDADPVRCLDPAASAAMVAEIDAAQKDGDTLGGVVEVLAYGLPPGLGSHVHWDRRLDSRLAGALMGIQAIKGVGVGDGFDSAARRGSQAHDEIERGADGGLHRRTARAGGIEGGMTTGEPLRVRAAMKPISTVPARPRHRRRRHRRAGPGDQPAQRRVRGARGRHRRRGDGGAGAGRRRAGEVRRRLGDRDRAQRRGLPRAPAGDLSGAGRRAGGTAGVGQVDGGPGRRRPARRGVPRHRRRRRGRRRAAASRTSSSSRARSTSGTSSGPRSPPPWPSTTGCSRSAAAPCSTRGPGTCCAGRHGRVPRRRDQGRRPADRPQPGPAAAARQPAGAVDPADGGPSPALRGGRDGDRR